MKPLRTSCLLTAAPLGLGRVKIKPNTAKRLSSIMDDLPGVVEMKLWQRIGDFAFWF